MVHCGCAGLIRCRVGSVAKHTYFLHLFTHVYCQKLCGVVCDCTAIHWVFKHLHRKFSGPAPCTAQADNLHGSHSFPLVPKTLLTVTMHIFSRLFYWFRPCASTVDLTPLAGDGALCDSATDCRRLLSYYPAFMPTPTLNILNNSIARLWTVCHFRSNPSHWDGCVSDDTHKGGRARRTCSQSPGLSPEQTRKNKRARE
jgi:hypothetical protein